MLNLVIIVGHVLETAIKIRSKFLCSLLVLMWLSLTGKLIVLSVVEVTREKEIIMATS